MEFLKRLCESIGVEVRDDAVYDDIIERLIDEDDGTITPYNVSQIAAWLNRALVLDNKT